jgi:hypothetical protein
MYCSEVLSLVGPTNWVWWALKPCCLSNTQYSISQSVHFKTGREREREFSSIHLLYKIFVSYEKKFAEHRCRVVFHCCQVLRRYYLFTANLFPLWKRLGVGEGHRGTRQCSSSRSSCPSCAIRPCTPNAIPLRYSHVQGGTPYIGVLAPNYDQEDIEGEGITGITVRPLTRR